MLASLFSILRIGSALARSFEAGFIGILLLVEAVHSLTISRVYPEVLIDEVIVDAVTLHILLRPDDDPFFTIEVRKLDDLIPQPRSVSTQAPGEVADTQDLSAELELKTIVADLPNITINAGGTRRGSKLILEEQVLRLLVEDFDRTIDSVKEAEFKSHVRGNLSFPRQVGIPDMCYTQPRFIEVIAGAVGSLIGIVAREPIIPVCP